MKSINLVVFQKNKGGLCSLGGIIGLDGMFGRYFDDYGRDSDREHCIDDDSFCGFVGHSNLFDDFSLIIAFLCELFDLIRCNLAFLMNKLN